MQIANIIARVLIGLVFVIFGLNGFLGFIELPPLPETAGAFMGALYSSGFLSLIKALEIGAGALLLASIALKRYAPLALTILTPIIFVIFFFHLFMAPASIALPIILIVLNAFLLYSYRDQFAGIFAAHS